MGYFSSHTEVNWSKKNRMTHDNQGIGDCSSHNSHFGMRKANKHHVTMFPSASSRCKPSSTSVTSRNECERPDGLQQSVFVRVQLAEIAASSRSVVSQGVWAGCAQHPSVALRIVM